jgi:two-component system nitrate/nitrite response regulator NarL
LVEGYSNKVIAHRIGIAEATVKTHIKAILRKVRVQNRTQAAVWAMNKGERAAVLTHLNGAVLTTKPIRDIIEASALSLRLVENAAKRPEARPPCRRKTPARGSVGTRPSIRSRGSIVRE